MTLLPPRAKPGDRMLGLVIDLDTCVGCHACAVNCKEWNTGGIPRHYRIMIPTVLTQMVSGSTVFTRSRRAREPIAEQCISSIVSTLRRCSLRFRVPPTGASYKRDEDGIVLVNEDACIGCKLCSWACPYGAREYDTRRRCYEKMHAVHRPDI